MANGSEPAEDRSQLTDAELLQEASEVLKTRLGTVGYLRYLRLTHGGSDNFEDLRKSWNGMGLHDVLAALGNRE